MRRGMQRKSIGSEGAQRLAAIHVFQGLTVGERRMLARLVDELSAAPGEELMHEGTFGYEVVFVESGYAEVRHGDAAIATVGAGDMVGDLAVLGAAGTRNATVVATAPLRGVVLTSHFMHHVRKQMPALAEQIDRAAAQHQPA